MADLKITLIKSTSGAKKNQIATVKALGLKKLHYTVTQPDNEQIRGMIRNVEHMVKVEEA